MVTRKSITPLVLPPASTELRALSRRQGDEATNFALRFNMNEE